MRSPAEAGQARTAPKAAGRAVTGGGDLPARAPAVHDWRAASGGSPGCPLDGRAVRLVRHDPGSPVDASSWPAAVPALEQVLGEGVALPYDTIRSCRGECGVRGGRRLPAALILTWCL